jgi:ABC-type multidrug transport system fused ATPase/permease subunit
MQIFQSLGINPLIYNGMMVGGQSRGVLIGMIYEKAMVISGRARAGDSEDNLMAQMEGQTEKGKKEKAKREEKKEKNDKKGKRRRGAEEDAVGWGNGRIVNLMSVDTYRIDQASALLHMIWTAPVSLLITLALLLVNLSYNALAGFGLLVIGAPLLTWAIRSLFRRRKDINKITDQRVSLTQEILQSVRFVKFFGWEEAFLGRLAEYRDKEIYSIQILLAIRNAINAVSMALPIFASMLSFISYSLTNPNLPPAEIFSSLALFNGLRIPLNLLPLVLGQSIDAWSSMKRIQQFLTEEEQEEDFIMKEDGPNAVELRGATFTWEKSVKQDSAKKDEKKGKQQTTEGIKEKPSGQAQPKDETRPESSGADTDSTLAEVVREPFKLQDLNLEIGRNELIAVIGSVGSGKSSLLGALAGDMRKTNGEVVFGASRAFCPQYAWIQNTTVRNNITFGKELDKAWYNEVIKA